MRIIKFNTEAEAIAAEARICQNAGIPNNMGTERWSEVRHHPEGFFYIIIPDEKGWRQFTDDEMLNGVSREFATLTEISENNNA